MLPGLLEQQMAEISTALEAAKRAEQRCPLSEKPHWTAERSRLEKQRDRTRSTLESVQTKDRERQALSDAIKQERAKQKQGKAPWYMKKGMSVTDTLLTLYSRESRHPPSSSIRRAQQKWRQGGNSQDNGEETTQGGCKGEEETTS